MAMAEVERSLLAIHGAGCRGCPRGCGEEQLTAISRRDHAYSLSTLPLFPADPSASSRPDPSSPEARGLLQFHLCRLRVELQRLFFHHRYRWGLRATALSLFRRARVALAPPPALPLLQAWSALGLDAAHAQLPLDYGPGGGDSAENPSEYESLCRDVGILAAPDWAVCGCQKIATAQRMRVTYQCFVPPVL